MFRESCFENVVSNLCKNGLCVHKTTLEKSAKTKKEKNKNHESAHNLQQILGTKLVLLVDFRDHIFKTVSTKHFFFFFSILHSKMSRNMCKFCHKVRYGQNLPNESPNFINYFFLSNFMDSLIHFYTSLRPHYQNSFFSLNIFFSFSTQNSRRS